MATDAKKVAKFGVSNFEYGKVDEGDLVKTTQIGRAHV